MAHVGNLPKPRSETTDLERRVLAHERVLQALIACIARTEPRFIDHLRERLVEPMKSVRREHDHRETIDYTEEFIRAVIVLGDTRVLQPKEPKMTDEQAGSPERRERQALSMQRPAQRNRVQVRERSGVWEVKVDGKFRGDYHQKEHALAAAALLKFSPHDG